MKNALPLVALNRGIARNFMTPSETTLWNHLRTFQLDDPQVSFKFSTRLARENGWTIKYTLRVIEEYKKFIFLCCISETGITPSDPIDQAWHLHLTYTKSYWTDLCQNTLKKEIHHNPTKGGQSEANKFDNFYTTSQNLYKEKFGYEPPKDIWHDNETRFADIDFQRVNLRKYWLLRKPATSLRNNLVKIFILLIGLSFVQASDDNAFWIFLGVVIALGAIVAIINAFRGKGGKSDSGDSGYYPTGCTADNGHHHHHHGDSGCSSGCSGCSASGCSGCGSSGE